MPNPKPGTRWLLNDTLGDPSTGIAAGAVCTVREVVDAAAPGAHNDREDAVVLETDQHTVGYDGDGKPVVVTSARAFTVPADTFADQFTKED